MEQKCIYDCDFHRGSIQWHHPISSVWHCGMFLCEAHHSLLLGRRKKYHQETLINKTLDEMRAEIKELERQKVIEQGFDPTLIDKH